jgi:hypothetical protein
MRIRFISILILCLATSSSFLLSGCGSGSQHGKSQDTLHAKGAHGRKYTLVFSQLPKARKNITVRLTIHTPHSQTTPIQKVWVTGSMPGMVMPPMKDSLHRLKTGIYSGTLLFVMSGKWDLKVHVMTKSNQFTDDFLFHVKN